MKTFLRCSCLLVSLLVIPLHAAIKYWDIDGPTAGAGGATPAGTWDSTTTNWNTDSVGTNITTIFANNDDVVFSAGSNATGTYTITLNGTRGPASITVEEGTPTISGGTALKPGNGVAGKGDINVAAGRTLTIASTITGGDNTSRFSKSGNGVLTLTATGNSFTNGLTINAGTLSQGGESSSTAGNASFTGILPAVTIPNYISLNGPAAVLRGTRVGVGVTFLATAKGITLNGGGQLEVTDTTAGDLNIYSGVIAGTGPLIKNAGGVLSLAGANTYSGATIVSNGTLRIRTSSNRIPTGTDLSVWGNGVFDPGSTGGNIQQVNTLNGNGKITFSASSGLIIAGSGSSTFSGIISDGTVFGNVQKSGSGTLTLSGVNTYDGRFTNIAGTTIVTSTGQLCDPGADVVVNGGSLVFSNATQGVENLTGTGGTINLAATNHVLTINPVNSALSSTYSGVITGQGGITKIGTPTESLFGANTYSGPTTISVGKLNVGTVHAGTGSFTVADSATLGVVVSSPGTTMKIGDLNLGSSKMEFDFARLGFPTATLITNVSSTNTVTINASSTSVDVKNFDTLGTVTLLKYSGAIQSGGTFALGQIPPNMAVTLSNDTVNSQLILNASSWDSIRWDGDATSSWDVNNGGNPIWKLVNAGTPTYYQETSQGDTVRFDDNATGLTTITLFNPVTPYNMTVSNSVLPYAFTGPGAIAGAFTLIKNGTADLSMGTANTYSGGTLFNAGTLTLGGDSALGTGKLTMFGTAIRSDSGTARTLSVPVDMNTDLTLGSAVNTGNLTFSGSWKLLGGSRQFNVDTVTAAINGVISQDVSGRAVTKTGSGTLDLGNANTFSGGFNHNAGTVRVNNNSALGAANTPVSLGVGVTLATTTTSARTLTYPFTLTGDLTLGQDTSGTAGALTLAGSVDLGGTTRTITVPNLSTNVISAVITNGGIIKSSSGTLDLTGANTFTGGFSLAAGTVRVNNNTALGATNTSVSLASGVTLSAQTTSARTLTHNFSVNGDFTLGQASGGTAALTLAGNVDFGGATRTVTVANTSDTISAPISNGTLTKAGTGTLTLSGINNFTGDTTINEGTLQVTTSTLSGHVADNSGATLTFSQTTNGVFHGSIGGFGTVTKIGASTVTLTNEDTYTGTTTVTAGGVLINGSSQSQFSVNNALLGGIGTVYQNANGVNATFAPGDNTVSNTIGQLKFISDFVVSGTNQWELGSLTDDTDGTPGVDFDQITAAGTFATNGPFVISLNFTNSAVAPDFAVSFWQASHKWTVLKMNGGSNPNSAGFVSVRTNAYYYAGTFSTAVEPDGSLSLSYTPAGATAPIILAQPANKSVVLGGTTNLTVSATGTAPLSYQWYFNSNPVGPGTASSLPINSATLADNGPYFVVVGNGSGSVTSSVATLTVAVAPTITGQPQDQTVAVGGTATFNVTATGSPLGYQWKKNGGNISGATNSSYTTPILQVTDNGNLYSVVVTNFAGGVLSSNAVLTVGIAQPVLALGVTNSSATLNWSSIIGKVYRPQFNLALGTTNWTDIPPDLTATATNTVVTNSVAGTNSAFYRVIMLP